MTKTVGMVLGKFLPPHKGHLYLAEFAKNYVDTLYVVVGTLAAEPIPGDLRYRWMKQMLPHCEVLHLTDENPQDPSEHADFWSIWQDSLAGILPQKPDFVFASESYGYKLAEVLNAQFVPVDLPRSNISVSGTDIREKPLAHWHHIPWPVRQYYLKRVCIFGPESCGKTTLTHNLANAFDTVFVPEYARAYLEEKEGKLLESDMPVIARGQVASEDALARHGKGILFCDTDPLTTQIWSEFLYQQVDADIVQLANERHYDLYILCDVDVPWVEDQVRYLPNDRENFLELCENKLIQTNRPYVKVSGDWQQRLQQAIDAVKALLG